MKGISAIIYKKVAENLTAPTKVKAIRLRAGGLLYSSIYCHENVGFHCVQSNLQTISIEYDTFIFKEIFIEIDFFLTYILFILKQYMFISIFSCKKHLLGCLLNLK